MNQQSNDPEYATAVAAAAYAIKSLEETIISDQKKKKKAEPPPEPAPTIAISKREGTSSAILGSGRFSGKNVVSV